MALLTGAERKQATSISGFKTGNDFIDSEPLPSSGYNILPEPDKNLVSRFGNIGLETRSSGYGTGVKSDILSRVDVSSNEEFVVGTSLSMGDSSSSSSGSSYSSGGSLYSSDSPGFNSGGFSYSLTDKLENELIKKVPSNSYNSGNIL